MRLETIAEHTIDADIKSSLPVLDAGCRGFEFAREMMRRGYFVYALDPAVDIKHPAENHIAYSRLALAGVEDIGNPMMFQTCDDPQAGYLIGPHHHINDKNKLYWVETWGLKTFMRVHGIDRWSIVKLDIEGAEYNILMNWPGPIADQITVEFHEHVCPQPAEVYERILSHLGQWYSVAQHVKTARHGAGMNYWDSLWVLK